MSLVPNMSHKTPIWASLIASSFLFSLTSLSALANTSITPPSMPIAFEQNQGQAPAGVKFISRGASGMLFLSPSEITLRAPGKAAPFRLKLQGATSTPSVVGTGERSGNVNYFNGSQSSAWLTNIPSYTQVTYRNVYPHIDLIVYGNNRQFESDFVVAQDANPATIAFQIEGKVELRQDGSLAAQSAGGAFQLHKPFVYQLASNGERVAVDCHYAIGAGNKISFALGRYDHSKSLVIDPVLTYSTYAGGNGNDLITGITADLAGNIYVTGQTSSTNIPLVQPIQKSLAGSYNCFVAKFDPFGLHLLYSTYLGGNGSDRCNGIAVNLLGEAFVGGTTSSTNFPTYNAYQSTLKVSTGAQNGFVTHLNCFGSGLIFSTYLGGGGEALTGIALDLASNVYVVGETNSSGFPTTKGAFQTTYGSCSQFYCENAFLSKLPANGSSLIYSTYLGGNNSDGAHGVAVDLLGCAYVVGQANSTNFPTQNAIQPKLAGNTNAFITKVSPTGSTLVYSTYIGGSNFDVAQGIALDLLGNAYVTGYTNSTNFPVVNAYQSQLSGTQDDIFVLKLNTAGSALDYSTYFGGSGFQQAFGISIDLFGNTSVVGETSSLNFPLKGQVQSTLGGTGPTVFNAVVAGFNANGALNYSTYLGGNVFDQGIAVYSLPTGCGVLVAGQTYSTNFPVTKNAFQGSPSGPSQAFVSLLTAP